MANYQRLHDELSKERQRLHDLIQMRSKEGLQASIRNVEATIVLGTALGDYQCQQDGTRCILDLLSF